MRIKMTVSTGWANGDHTDYAEAPDNWESMTEDEKDAYAHECATEYLYECCSASGEFVEDDDDD